jgi:hypothetical protein
MRVPVNSDTRSSSIQVYDHQPAPLGARAVPLSAIGMVGLWLNDNDGPAANIRLTLDDASQLARELLAAVQHSRS